MWTETVYRNQKEYEYQKKLTSGYRLAYYDDGELQHLVLKRSSTKIRELSTISSGLPQKNLGYIGADFRDYFVLVHSYGSGNPHEIELIQKSTGRNTISEGSAWIDVDQKKDMLLYSPADVPRPSDRWCF